MRHSIFRQIKPGWKRFMRGTTGLLVVLLFWALLSRRHHPLILPSPGETFKAMRGLWQSGSLWVNIIITLRRTLLGYSLALLAGTILALLLKASPFWQDFFRPIITVIQIIPPVVWVVFAVIWFGIAADLTPVFLIFIVTFPIIFINIFSGLDSIDSRLVEMARVYRCFQEEDYHRYLFSRTGAPSGFGNQCGYLFLPGNPPSSPSISVVTAGWVLP